VIRRAEEFRRQAQECFDLARAISLETQRAILIDMAQTYLRLAKEQEAQQEIIPPPVTGQPQPSSNSKSKSTQGRRYERIDRLSWRL